MKYTPEQVAGLMAVWLNATQSHYFAVHTGGDSFNISLQTGQHFTVTLKET